VSVLLTKSGQIGEEGEAAALSLDCDQARKKFSGEAMAEDRSVPRWSVRSLVRAENGTGFYRDRALLRDGTKGEGGSGERARLYV